MTSLLPRPRSEIAPGAVHVPDWLSIDAQRDLVAACRRWARPPAPMHHTRTPGGGVMSVQTVCLGWHWSPYRYTRTAVDVDGAPVEPVPAWLGDLGRRALADAHGPDAAAGYDPDTALVNFYDADARMGLHQDKDERSDLPVVSLSIGDTCTFRFGNTENRGRPYTDVELQGGDLFVFGGPSRFAFHGVPRVRPGTGDPATGGRRRGPRRHPIVCAAVFIPWSPGGRRADRSGSIRCGWLVPCASDTCWAWPWRPP